MLTFEWLFSCVNSFMFFQISISIKSWGTTLTFEWLFSRIFNVSFRLNLYSQCWHLNGFSPVWILSWINQFFFSIKIWVTVLTLDFFVSFFTGLNHQMILFVYLHSNYVFLMAISNLFLFVFLPHSWLLLKNIKQKIILVSWKYVL